MAEDDSQEKTEEPSQRRIEKALEDGQVLSSKEMFVFTSLITGLIFVLGLGAFMPSLLDIWRGYFMLSSAEDLQDQILQNITSALSDFLILSLVVAVPILLVAFTSFLKIWSSRPAALTPSQDSSGCSLLMGWLSLSKQC